MSFDEGTIRRLVVAGIGLISVIFGRKLDLDDTQLQAIVALIGVYLTGSNVKEAMIARAKAAGDAAASSVTKEDAGAILKDAANKGAQ